MDDFPVMPPVSPAKEIELLADIINSLPPKAPPSDLDTLCTGHRLWEIFQFCAPDEFPSSLPSSPLESSQKWVARHENLKRISKTLSDVLARNELDSSPASDIDIKAIAEKRSAARTDLAKLLRMFVRITTADPLMYECAPVIQQLEHPAPVLCMNIHLSFPETPWVVETREDDLEEEGEGNGGMLQVATPTKRDAKTRKSIVESARDPELYKEEVESAKDKQILLLQTQKGELEDTIRQLEHRIERLRKNNQDLDEKIKFVEDSLRKNEASGSQEAHIYSLESKIENQDRLIEEQEDQLNKLRKEYDRVNAELNLLRKANEDIQPLKDQVDELQHLYDEASRKANTVDKYVQKLSTMQALERNFRDLQGRYEELRHDMGAGDSASTEIAGLRRTIDEYKRLLPTIEIERHEISDMYQTAKEDINDLQEQLNAKKEELSRAEETITELRNGQGMTPIDASMAALGSEMEDSERKAELEAMDPEERSRVLLKDLQDERAKAMSVASQLDDQKTLYTQLEKRWEDLRAEKNALERAAKTASEVPPTPPPKDDVVVEDGEKGDEISELEAENAKLKERIKLMETQDPQAKKAADSALMRQELLSLRNETKLISSAWYGLNKRSQLNSVILQKKTETPQGFLGRARNQIERAAKVRGR